MTHSRLWLEEVRRIRSRVSSAKSRTECIRGEYYHIRKRGKVIFNPCDQPQQYNEMRRKNEQYCFSEANKKKILFDPCNINCVCTHSSRSNHARRSDKFFLHI